jgi:uncharacterized membrane protein
MRLRSTRERVIQTLCYESGGLVLSIPVYVLYSGHAAGEGAALMAAVSVAVMIWAPLHNTTFDWLDLRCSGRVASERPQGLRMVHAVSLEASAVVATLPILVWFGGHHVADALLVDLGLTGLYAVYAYGFHLVYDRLRPVEV